MTLILRSGYRTDRGAARGDQRLLLVGNPGVVHVGAHLAHAAESLGLSVRLVDVSSAFSSSVWINRFRRRLWARRPAHMRRFNQLVLDACRSFQPSVLLATGISPIGRGTLRAIRKLGIRTCNYLTDDPFNPAHRSRWLTRALPAYDCIFSPRRANLADLEAAGCGEVVYMPFAYAPEIHFPEAPEGPSESDRYAADVFFAGGADHDRIAYMSAMIEAGLRVALYGGYWERYPETRAAALGMADARTVRKAAAGAKLSLCLVRRANRDGHSMRSFELPAMRGCPVVEDTAEHRAIFGPPSQTVEYFQTVEELVTTVKRLTNDGVARERLAASCHTRICSGRNTYKDRLAEMLACAAKA